MHIQVFLLIKMIHLVYLTILVYFITKALVLRFSFGKCIQISFAGLCSMSLKSFCSRTFISIVKGSCRNFTLCTNETCPGLKKKVIRVLFYKKVEFCLYLLRASCELVNSDFIYNVYRTFQKDRDFFNCFLEFGRNEQFLHMSEV